MAPLSLPFVCASRLKAGGIMFSSIGSDSGSSVGGSYHGTADSGRCCRCNLVTITPDQGRIKVDNPPQRNHRRQTVVAKPHFPWTKIEQIQRKTRVRDKTPQNAPRTRPDVEKEDQKAELKKNQTRRRYVEKTSIFFQTTGRHPPGARRETTEVKTRKC